MLNTGYSESFKFCPLAVHPFNRVLTQSTSVNPPPPNLSKLPHWSWIVSDLPSLMIGQMGGGGAYIQTLRKGGSVVSKKTIFQPFGPQFSGRKNVLRKLLRIPYRRLKAAFFCVLIVLVCCWSSEWNAQGANVCSLWSIFIWHVCFFFDAWKLLWIQNNQC